MIKTIPIVPADTSRVYFVTMPRHARLVLRVAKWLENWANRRQILSRSILTTYGMTSAEAPRIWRLKDIIAHNQRVGP